MTFTSCDRHHIWSLSVPQREVYPKIHSRFPLFEPHHAVPPIRQLIDATKPVCCVASTGGRIGSTGLEGQGEFSLIFKKLETLENKPNLWRFYRVLASPGYKISNRFWDYRICVKHMRERMARSFFKVPSMDVIRCGSRYHRERRRKALQGQSRTPKLLRVARR